MISILRVSNLKFRKVEELSQLSSVRAIGSAWFHSLCFVLPECCCIPCFPERIIKRGKQLQSKGSALLRAVRLVEIPKYCALDWLPERGVSGLLNAVWIPCCREGACSRQCEVRYKGENVPVMLEGPDRLELRISLVMSWEFRWKK